MPRAGVAAAHCPLPRPVPVRRSSHTMLSVFEAGRLVIRLGGGWLYPLLVLYMAAGRGTQPLFRGADVVSCQDTKIGQGAVFLYAALGIGSAHGELASRLAADKAAGLGIALTAQEWVDSLECRTESLLLDLVEAGPALEILEGRLKREFFKAPGTYITVHELDRDSPAGRAIESYLSH